MDHSLENQMNAFAGELRTADGVIGIAGRSLEQTAHELHQLALDSEESRKAAALEAATEHFLGDKRVNRPLQPSEMSEDDWNTTRQLAALRELGRAKAMIDMYSRLLTWRLHRDAGVTGQRLAEPLGVSNATTSAWIREAKARSDD